jgi:hypothetical protein
MPQADSHQNSCSSAEFQVYIKSKPKEEQKTYTPVVSTPKSSPKQTYFSPIRWPNINPKCVNVVTEEKGREDSGAREVVNWKSESPELKRKRRNRSVLKTNYWSHQITSINEKNQKKLKGDGIPCVRRLLPKERYSSERHHKKIYGKSILSYLMQKSKETKRCLKHHPVLNRDINDSENEAVISFNEKAYASEMRVQKKVNGFNDASDHSFSRNKSFTNTNYDQGMYSIIDKDLTHKTKLVCKNQMFYKRVKMFNKQKEKMKFERIRNVHKNSRGSLNIVKSSKFFS